MNFNKNYSKEQKGIVKQYVAQFVDCGERKFFFYYLSPFIGLIKNSCIKQSKFSSGFAPFKHGKKNNLSEYFSARF